MNTKSGYVTIVGKPNVGKSTLMNELLGERLSIITSKPQTTRKRVLGILTEENYQIIFLDTPGILDPSYLLQEKLLEYIELSINDADVLIVLIDLSDPRSLESTIEDELVSRVIKNNDIKKLAVLNKVDETSKEEIDEAIKKLETNNLFESIIPISALKKFNVDTLKKNIIELLPEGPKYYPDDQLTDEPERFFVSEIIREKVFITYKEEIPFSTEIVIEEFKERENRKDFISASIIVERDSQKPIIIGKKGEAIKKVGKYAREDIEKFLQREVYLELNVKVRNKWRSNANLLKSFGYNLDEN
jgi:GTP-binding protein Era